MGWPLHTHKNSPVSSDLNKISRSWSGISSSFLNFIFLLILLVTEEILFIETDSDKKLPYLKHLTTKYLLKLSLKQQV